MKKKNFSKICFLHIPKTAGTTVTHLISRNYEASELAPIYFKGKHHLAIAEAVAQPEVKIIFGHYTFAEVVPFDGLYHFTFLRHPLERTVSHFLHLKYSPDLRHKQMMLEAVDLPGFLKMIQGNNLQARRLVHVYAPTLDKMEESDIAIMAKENMKNMSFVGISERFNESISVVAHDLGWRLLAHTKKNKSSKKDEAQQLKAKYTSEILAANQIDIQLYEYGLKLLEEKLEKLSLKDKINQKLKFLK